MKKGNCKEKHFMVFIKHLYKIKPLSSSVLIEIIFLLSQIAQAVETHLSYQIQLYI